MSMYQQKMSDLAHQAEKQGDKGAHRVRETACVWDRLVQDTIEASIRAEVSKKKVVQRGRRCIELEGGGEVRDLVPIFFFSFICSASPKYI